MKNFLKKFEKYELFKILGIIALLLIILTWIVPNGTFSGTELTSEFNRIGFADLGTIFYYSFNFSMDKILFLLVLGGFYGILNGTSAYKKLVNNIAKSLKGKEIYFVLGVSLFIALITSVLTQTFAVLVFVPFFINVMLNMKLDKMTAFAATFGSMLIGIVGATFGGEGIYFFGYYFGSGAGAYDLLTQNLGLRFGILALVFVLFSFFTVLHVKKVLKEKNTDDKEEELFALDEKLEVDKKTKVYPTVIVLVLLGITILLGYFSWVNNFSGIEGLNNGEGITIFSNAFNWLKELTIGSADKNYTIFSYLLGSKAAAFGDVAGAGGLQIGFDLFILNVLLFVSSILIAIVNKINFSAYLDGIAKGVKKMLKPISIFILVFFVFVICYWSSFIPAFTKTIMSLTNSFNPFTTALSAFVTNIFNVDFGYTSYLIAPFMTGMYADSTNIIFIIYSTMYGFVQFAAPTSLVLVIGLSYLNISYKNYLKYIWKFLLGLLACLLLVFTLLTYL